ncbi:MAG: hypothetical protein WKF75_03255 [Singulisphaera sp.]
MPGARTFDSANPKSPYRWLTTNLKLHADTFLCTTGFNSLYFWTGTSRRP